MASSRRKAVITGNMVRDGQAEAVEAEGFSKVPTEARASDPLEVQVQTVISCYE